MMFIMSMQEISATIFIYKPSWETLPIGIFLQWWHGSEFGYPSSLGLILLIKGLFVRQESRVFDSA